MTQPIERNCPKCGAQPGLPCVGGRGSARRSFHRERGSRLRLEEHDTTGIRADSPIERALLGSILSWIAHNDAQVEVSTQEPVGPFRADILVTDGDRRLVVEADGAEFHNSPEQVERDKRRDRFCATQGIAVMRFTGAEITRDPRGCAAEVGLWILRK